MRTIMNRWVEVVGRRVTFGNLVGGYVGLPYTYSCDSDDDAKAFGKFLEQRDPENQDMPTAVTPADTSRFKATVIP